MNATGVASPWVARALCSLLLIASCAPRVALAQSASSPVASPPRATAAYGSVLERLTGHWSCTDAHGSHSERSYVMPDERAFRSRRAPHETFGREVATLDGKPTDSYERLAEPSPGIYTDESPEGVGQASVAADTTPAFATVVFGGRSGTGTSYTLTYVENGTESLERIAADGDKTISDEHCTREHDAVAADVQRCASPNQPPRTVHVVEPDGRPGPGGLVTVMVVLDDRSDVVWTEVVRSPWEAYDAPSIWAARTTTYRTAERDCKPVPGVYDFVVQFDRA